MIQRDSDKFGQLFESMPVAALVIERDGDVVRANRAAEATFRAARQMLTECSIGDLFPTFFERPDFRWIGSAATEAGAPAPERWVEVAALALDGTAFMAEILASNLRTSVDESFVVFARTAVAHSPADDEVRRHQDLLCTVQRMEAIGSLAAGVAHDLNNWLSVVLSCTTLALEALSTKDAIRLDLEEAHGAAEYAADLTRRLLAVGGNQTAQQVNVNERLLCAQKLLARLVGKRIQLSMDLKAVGSVQIDPIQLDQILLNLAINARDAMPHGGRLVIETANATFPVDPDNSLTSRDYAVITVTDTGTGMDEATLARIFEPFFTTKASGKATGIGLSTVLGIVKRQNGEIRVRSDVGRGTAFEIYLPCSENVSESDRSTRTRARGPESAGSEPKSQIRKGVRSLRRTG
jgi:two-component system, cell cycle sensor histidine kinase and response regulator CckA